MICAVANWKYFHWQRVVSRRKSNKKHTRCRIAGGNETHASASDLPAKSMRRTTDTAIAQGENTKQPRPSITCDNNSCSATSWFRAIHRRMPPNAIRVKEWHRFYGGLSGLERTFEYHVARKNFENMNPLVTENAVNLVPFCSRRDRKLLTQFVAQ